MAQRDTDAGGYPVDQNFYYGFNTSWADTDTEVVNKTIALINSAATDASSFMFSYQVQVDEAGHSYGGGSPEYAQAVTNVRTTSRRSWTRLRLANSPPARTGR